jgi:hypothetical protein
VWCSKQSESIIPKILASYSRDRSFRLVIFSQGYHKTAAMAGRAPHNAETAESRDGPQVFPDTTPDWNNLKVIHRNTLPPRAHFHVYDTEEEALTRDVTRSKAQLLSGPSSKWLFQLSPSPSSGATDFHAYDFDVLAGSEDWSRIEVPGMWQCQGFGRGPQYTVWQDFELKGNLAVGCTTS